jgi:hypothetical protein
MKATIELIDQTVIIDLSKPIDISIPLTNTDENPIAWYIEKPVIEPVVFGDWGWESIGRKFIDQF